MSEEGKKKGLPRGQRELVFQAKIGKTVIEESLDWINAWERVEGCRREGWPAYVSHRWRSKGT